MSNSRAEKSRASASWTLPVSRKINAKRAITVRTSSLDQVKRCINNSVQSRTLSLWWFTSTVRRLNLLRWYLKFRHRHLLCVLRVFKKKSCTQKVPSVLRAAVSWKLDVNTKTKEKCGDKWMHYKHVRIIQVCFIWWIKNSTCTISNSSEWKATAKKINKLENRNKWNFLLKKIKLKKECIYI